jgi:hypothetical protein
VPTSRDDTEQRNEQYPTTQTPGVRRYRIAATPTMSTDVEAAVEVLAVDDTDARTLRTVSTAHGGGKRFVEVGLAVAARRALIEALGGTVGPDWEE